MSELLRGSSLACVVRSTTIAAVLADRAGQRSKILTMLISKIPYENALEP